MKQIAVSVLLSLLCYTWLASYTRACVGDGSENCTQTEDTGSSAVCMWHIGDNSALNHQEPQRSEENTDWQTTNITLYSTKGNIHCLRFLCKSKLNIDSDFKRTISCMYKNGTEKQFQMTTTIAANIPASVKYERFQNFSVIFPTTAGISSQSMSTNISITCSKTPCDSSRTRGTTVWDSSYSQSTSKTLEITEQSETPTTTENAITSQHMTTSSHSEEGDSSSSEKSNSSTSGESRVRTGRVVGAVVGAVLLTVVIVVFVIAVAKRIRPFRFGKNCFKSRQHKQQSGCVNEHFNAPDTRMTIEEDMATSTAADNISRRQTERFQQHNGLTDRFKDNHDSSRINQTLPPLRTVHLFEEDSGSNYVPVTVRALYENNRQADPFEEDSDGYYVPVTPRTHVDNKQQTEPFNVDSNGYLGPLTTRTHAENKQQTEQFDEDSNGYFVPVTPRDHAENKQQTKPFHEDINGNLVPVTIRTHAENKQQTKQFDEDSDGYCYLVPVTPTTHDENKHHAEQFEEDSDSYEVPRQRTDDGGNMENQAQILDNDNNRKYGAARFYLPAMARKAAHSYDNCLDFVDVNTATEKQLYIDEPIYDNNIAWTGKDESTDVHVYAKDQGRSHYEEMNLI